MPPSAGSADRPDMSRGEAVAQKPSIARNSLARLTATTTTLVFGFVAGAITARVLGPAGKGTLSALLFMGDVLLTTVCTLGLGEAAIILIGKGKTSPDRALATALVPLAVMSVLGLGALLVVAVPADWDAILPAVLIEGLTLTFLNYQLVFRSIMESRECFGLASRVVVISGAVTVVMTVILVAILDLGIAGAVAAESIGVGVATFEAIRTLRTLGLWSRPKWDPGYIREALRFGIPLQTSYLLIALAYRLDQLIVYALLGEAFGGRYAVALTVGQLSAYAAGAVSMGAFPRVANLEEPEVLGIAARLSRVSLAATFVITLVMVALTPLLVPAVFGAPYSSSVVPTLVLLVGGALAGEVSVLTRVAVARGDTTLKLKAFGASVVVMVVADLLLIPRFEMVGAAVGSAMGGAAGLLVCIHAYWKMPRHIRMREFLPSKSDFSLLSDFLKSLLRAARGRGSG